MDNTKKSQVVELDLEETVPADVLAKLYYLCKKRKLKFPEGIVLLLQEVSEPSEAKPLTQRKAKSMPKSKQTFSRSKKVR